MGEKEGVGYNFNVPLNKTGMTNGDYLAIFQQVLLPMAYEVSNTIYVYCIKKKKMFDMRSEL